MSRPGTYGRLERRLVGDVDQAFFVPSYQRGYRWGRDEIVRLLDDVEQSDGDDYYLQPVVVKQAGDEWELIDGQQRLTTIYLVLQFMKNSGLKATGPAYSLRYATRESSAEFLHDPRAIDPSSTNIDFFHIHRAYKAIEKWFSAKGSRMEYAAGKFFTALFERVYIFWYEPPDHVDATTLFTRLNVGRIPLTDAELVKALLLTRLRGDGTQTNRALAVAAEWDLVERGLRDDELWAFVTSSAPPSSTHIDLLLDTVADGPGEAEQKGGRARRQRPAFLTFERLRQRIEVSPEEAEQVWAEVADLFNLVRGWYDDLRLFHRIGYLTATGTSFAEIVGLAHGRRRSDFEQVLVDRIRERLGLSRDDLADLSYEKQTDRGKLERSLLLMNVETVTSHASGGGRYSFKAHAAGEWSLEHIHAQGSEGLNRAPQWIAWLEYHRSALVHLPGLDEETRSSLMEQIDETLTDVTSAKFQAMESQLAPVFAPKESSTEEEVHSISNLALLGRRENSALNNSAFEVKRRMVLALDRQGAYVPACTRNVFLKYYTEDDVQLHFWSQRDRHAYFEEICRVLGPYLTGSDPTTSAADTNEGNE